jgi:glycosyltransferase involved in cell wall biosynthesis
LARAISTEALMVLAEPAIGGEIDFEQIVSAADIALFCARDPSPILPQGVCLFAGLPVVASESAETREFVQDDVSGLVEPSLNPRRLAQRVRTLQNDPRLRQKLARAARSVGVARFSADRFAADWRQVYSRVSGSDASRPMAPLVAF